MVFVFWFFSGLNCEVKMLLFINSFYCSFFQSSNVKCLLRDTMVKGKKRKKEGREGEMRGGRKGRRKEGEGYVIKSNGAR